MTVAANGIDQLSRSRDIAKKSGIDESRWGRLFRGSSRRAAAQTFGKSEELAPRLVNRSRIAPVGFVSLVYVPVVEHPSNRVTHVSKFNCAPLCLAHANKPTARRVR